MCFFSSIVTLAGSCFEVYGLNVTISVIMLPWVWFAIAIPIPTGSSFHWQEPIRLKFGIWFPCDHDCYYPPIGFVMGVVWPKKKLYTSMNVSFHVLSQLLPANLVLVLIDFPSLLHQYHAVQLQQAHHCN